MPTKGIRIVITGAQRPTLDVEAMTQIVIALGRELALRTDNKKRQTKVAASSGTGS
jgi:hypothetical protein